MSQEGQGANSQLSILQSIKGTELQVNVTLMEQDFSIGDLVALSPGSVLLFKQRVDEPAQLSVNGQAFAKGEVVQVGERYGLRVQKIDGPLSQS